MEHYLLCILPSTLSKKDNAVIEKYLNNLYASVYQYQYAVDFMESVAALLKPISRYVAVLNTCEENENIIWKSVCENTNILEIIDEDLTKTDSAIEYDQDSTNYISTSLHSLADQLPAVGTYKLDVLLGSDVLRELSIRKESALAGAFIRLTRWHSAHFTIFEQKEFDLERLNEWCEIVNAELFLQDSKLDLGPSLWRGAIQFQSSNVEDAVYRGFQLSLELNENKHCASYSVKDSTKHVLEHVILSCKLQVIDEVCFASIPTYLISPLTFRLHLSKLNILNENSFNLIEYLSSNEKAAFIVKLGYAEIKDKTRTERKYCSNRWQKAVVSGYLKDSECYVSSFEKFITFAITKSSNSNYVVAYPLHDPSNLDAKFYFNIVNHKIPSALNEDTEEKSIRVPVLKSGICPKNILDYLKQHMNNRKGSSDTKNNIDFSLLIEDEKNSYCCVHGDTSSATLSFEEIDPSDWPERIQLLHKQMKAEEKECVLTNAALIQNLKLPLQSFSLSSECITQYFLPSGEHKNSRKLDTVYSTNNVEHLVTSNMNDALELNWPDVLNCIYHDLYYNTRYQAEEKESWGSQLVKSYVQYETASTCNNQQQTQNFQITVSEKFLSPSKAFRGPSSRITNDSSSKNTKVIDRTVPSDNSLKDLITKKILASSQVENFIERKSSSKETDQRSLKRKNLVPTRCSPRKKKPVTYNPSVNRHSKSNNNLGSKIIDLRIKKMRCAVNKALENNGMNCTHPMYQPCGKKLLNICNVLFDEEMKKKKQMTTSEYLQKIADDHVKQVIQSYQD